MYYSLESDIFTISHYRHVPLTRRHCCNSRGCWECRALTLARLLTILSCRCAEWFQFDAGIIKLFSLYNFSLQNTYTALGGSFKVTLVAGFACLFSQTFWAGGGNLHMTFSNSVSLYLKAGTFRGGGALESGETFTTMCFPGLVTNW